MKKIYFLLMGIIALMFSSCEDEDKKVREFTNEFVDKVMNEDVHSLYRMIPGLSNCESFGLDDYVPGKVVFEKLTDGYHVQLTENSSMVVKVCPLGNLSVVSTHGVAVFDHDLYDFALRTGWVNPSMDDATIDSLLSENEFRDYMIEHIIQELRTKITVTGGETGGVTQRDIAVTVHNDTEYNIPGEAYNVVYRTEYDAFPHNNETITFDGEDLPAHSNIIMCGIKRGVGMATHTDVCLQFDEECLHNLCMLLYKANGHEYQDWKNGKLN